MKVKKRGQAEAWGIGAFLVIVIIGIIVGVAGFDRVDASHQGVMVRFGQITGTMEPGLRWTGIFTHVYQYDQRVRKMTVEMIGDQSATDKDGQAVYGTVSVNYRLKRDVVEDLYSEIGRDDVVVDKLLIEDIIREGFKQATVQYEAIEILEKRQEVKQLAMENIRNNFPEHYFDITDIVVTNIDFSDQFKQAIEDKKTATQEKLKEAELVEVVKLQQEQEIERYKAEAEKLRLQKAEVTALLNQQKMIDKWDGTLPVYLIITPESANNNMLLQLASGGLSNVEEEATP